MSALAFFRPAFLWGLLFLAVPILIHFFQRRRTLRFDFSSLRFLRDTAVKSSRRKKLRKLLLLLTRLGIVAVLILLFAHPYNPQDPFGVLRNPQGRTYVWTDATRSMEYQEESARLWKRARAVVGALDSVLARTHKRFVFDHCREEFVDRELREEHQCPPTRYGRTDLRVALRSFSRARSSDGHLPCLVLVSDFQEHDVAMLDSFFRSDSVEYPLLCVSLSPKAPYNFSLKVSSPPSGHNPRLGCTISARGRPLKEGAISVLSEGLRTGRQTVTCGEEDTVEVNVESNAGASYQSGVVTLDATDPYQEDNVDYYVAEQAGPVRVLVISEGEEAFSAAAAFGSLPSLDVRHMRVREVRFEDIDSADVILLGGLGQSSRPIDALFARGSLQRKLILYSPNMQEHGGAFETEMLRHFGAAAIRRVRAEKSEYPVLPDTVSALWEGFPHGRDRSVIIDEYFTGLPGVPVLRLSSGAPLVSYALDSTSHCWIFSSTSLCIDNSNNLAETGFYVPLLDRLVRFGLTVLQRRVDAWVAGEAQRNPFFGAGTSATVYDSDSRVVSEWSGQPVVGFDKPGVYKIQPRGQPAYWVAVRPDPREGELRYRRPDIAARSAAFVKILDEAAFGAFVKELSGDSRFNVLWIVLGALVLAELFLWDWRRPQDKKDA